MRDDKQSRAEPARQFSGWWSPGDPVGSADIILCRRAPGKARGSAFCPTPAFGAA
jgi:hypothetical protein